MSIEQQVNEYLELISLIKEKEDKVNKEKYDFEKSLTNTNHFSAENELKRYKLYKKLSPVLQEIKDLEKQQHIIEKNFSVTVSLGDFLDQIASIIKKTIITEIDDINYHWGKLNLSKVEDVVYKDGFYQKFDIIMYNKKYTSIPKFYLKKQLEFSSSIKFSDNSSLKDNIRISSSDYSSKIKLLNPNKLMINFNMKQLAHGSDVNFPIDVIRQAVINIIDKKQISKKGNENENSRTTPKTP